MKGLLGVDRAKGYNWWIPTPGPTDAIGLLEPGGRVKLLYLNEYGPKLIDFHLRGLKFLGIMRGGACTVPIMDFLSFVGNCTV